MINSDEKAVVFCSNILVKKFYSKPDPIPIPKEVIQSVRHEASQPPMESMTLRCGVLNRPRH